MADTPPTLAPDVLAAIALRAAIRAQPMFQFHSPPLPDDLREALEAIHACVWSGAAVFLSDDIRPDLLAPLELAVPIASPWLLDHPRPELVAARIVHSLSRTSSECGIDPLIAATRRISDVLLAVGRGNGTVEMKEFMEQLENHSAAKSADFAVLKAWIAGHRRTRWFKSDAIGRLATWAPRVLRHSLQAAHRQTVRELTVVLFGKPLVALVNPILS